MGSDVNGTSAIEAAVDRALKSTLPASQYDRAAGSDDLVADGILDSYAIIDLVARLETDLAIEIAPDQINADAFATVARIHALCRAVATGQPG